MYEDSFVPNQFKMFVHTCNETKSHSDPDIYFIAEIQKNPFSYHYINTKMKGFEIPTTLLPNYRRKVAMHEFTQLFHIVGATIPPN